MTFPALTMRPIVPTADAALIHRWVTEDRGTFWMMSDYSVADVEEIYTWLDEQPTHTASFVLGDGEPVAIIQTYTPEAEVEPVWRLVEAQPGDLGVHGFVAGGDAHVPGWTGVVLGFAATVIAAEHAVRRFVLDPDVDNGPAIAIAERHGAVRGPVVDLGFKRAQVLFLDADLVR